jgi:sodium-dependent dicarboxylate transporter 2/3/5
MNLFQQTSDFVIERLNLKALLSGDSRFASLIHYSQKQSSASGKLGLFLLVLAFAGFLTYLLAPSITAAQQYICFLLLMSLGLWLTEAVPPFAVGILIIAFLVFTQGSPHLVDAPVDVQRYVNTWSSPVIWLMLGGFFLAQAMEKTGLDQTLFNLTVRSFGRSQGQILLGLMLITTVGSMLMSNTATAAMMLACIMPLIKTYGATHPLSRALLLGIPAAASLGGMGTIIGSPPNAIAVGALNAAGIPVDFLTWMLYGAPLALVLSLSFWLWLRRGLDHKALVSLDFVEPLQTSPEQKQQRRLVVALFDLNGSFVVKYSLAWHFSGDDQRNPHCTTHA